MDQITFPLMITTEPTTLQLLQHWSDFNFAL